MAEKKSPWTRMMTPYTRPDIGPTAPGTPQKVVELAEYFRGTKAPMPSPPDNSIPSLTQEQVEKMAAGMEAIHQQNLQQQALEQERVASPNPESFARTYRRILQESNKPQPKFDSSGYKKY